MKITNEIIFIFTIIVLLFSCNDTSTNDSERRNSEIYFAEKANISYRLDKFKEAKLYYDSLLILNPFNSEYYYRRGYSKFMLLYDNKGATEDFFSAIKYDYINKKSAYLNIGTLYRIGEKYDSAIFFYNKALEIDSNYKKAKKEKNEVIQIITNLQKSPL